MLPADPAAKKKLLTKLAVGAAIVVGLAGLAAWGVDLRALAERGTDLLRHLGPWTFFLAMAFLPALGVPMSPFSLTAASVFSEQMGRGGVIAAALAAVGFNMVLTYCLARWAFRPWIAALCRRMGHKLPELDSGDVTDLIVVLRVVPGVPFFIQNYLLGLADAPFPRYILISCGVIWTYTVAIMFFGDAILHGKGGLAMAAGGVLFAAGAVAHFVRRHYAGRKKAAA